MLPFDFFAEMTEARIKMGEFNAVPGSASTAQTERRIVRYTSRTAAFAEFFSARGTW